ncbi:MAG TPA: ABC transporter permease, partial [Puia sp.]
MLKNCFRIAWRHLTKNKGYTFINIAGLSTGMAIAVIIGIWITDECTYDNYHKNHGRIAVGMVKQTANDGRSYAGATVTVPLGDALRTQYSGLFVKTALAHGGWGHLVASGEKKIQVDALWAQPEITDIFTFEMTKGAASSYRDPSTALITESLAKSLFGDGNPIGQPLKINNKIELKVGGVYKDQPENTSFGHIKILLPYNNNDNSYYLKNTNWSDHNGQLYLLMGNNTTTEQANPLIKNLPTPHIEGWHEEAFVYPLDRSHLYNEFPNGLPSGGRIQFVWLFGIIGVFILLLACINFMNLSTARSEKRAREVGIRKTVGSLKKQLVLQFLIESVLVATIAFVFALAIVSMSLPLFNQLAAKTMALPYNKGLFWALTAVFVLFTGILAGSYPAFYLSGFNPVRVLKGTFKAGRFASLPRKVLVVLQFTVSLTLIIGTIIVYRQIDYARDRPVGYSRDGLVGVWLNTPELTKNYEIIRQELIQKGIAANVTASSQSVLGFNNNNSLYWRGKRPEEESIFFCNVNVTPDFGRTIGWKVLQGRDFSREFATDTSSMILNDTAAKIIGIKNPIGETMKFFGKNYKVIGVVNNLVTNSPYEPVPP